MKLHLDKPSKHLSWNELKCKDGSRYPQEYIDDGRCERLVELFEDIRTLCGNIPIKVYSAYRTIEYNKLIGGTLHSQHVQGRALDLHHTSLTNNEFYKLIRINAKLLGIGGLGRYKTFVHVDIRPGNRIAYWAANGVKDSPA
jgi:uncharacterized protein YcbK (DUF882 family)